MCSYKIIIVMGFFVTVKETAGVDNILHMNPIKQMEMTIDNLKDEAISSGIITFEIFNSKHPENGIKVSLDNMPELMLTDFNPNLPLKVLIHGWTDTKAAYWLLAIKDAYMKSGEALNVLTVDWSPLAAHDMYLPSAMLTPNVGRRIAYIIDFLCAQGLASPNRTHIIGHSLGAHVAGAVGASMTAGRLHRITGLDPAKPGFEYMTNKDNHLDPSDAEFVDCIHTACGTVGYTTNIGHADFYPNGGAASQPGCTDIVLTCSHHRANLFYMESINSDVGFTAFKCPCHFRMDTCLSKCTSQSTVLMGDPCPQTARGCFYLRTNSKSPFAMPLFNVG